MKTDEKMSYRDFVFPNNPQVINIKHSRKISKFNIPNGNDFIGDFGSGSRIISGMGEFFGNNAENDFNNLKSIFEKGGGGILYIPSQKPIYAVFQSLELIGEDIEGVIKYKFSFIESFDNVIGCKNGILYADGKSCLWDYSYQNDISIENLVKINPDIMRPDIDIECGKRVNIC